MRCNVIMLPPFIINVWQMYASKHALPVRQVNRVYFPESVAHFVVTGIKKPA